MPLSNKSQGLLGIIKMELKYLASIIFIYLLVKDIFLFIASKKYVIDSRNTEGTTQRIDNVHKFFERKGSYFWIFIKFLLLNKWLNGFLYGIFVSIVLYYMIYS
jgi:hypothetical protein